MSTRDRLIAVWRSLKEEEESALVVLGGLAFGILDGKGLEPKDWHAALRVLAESYAENERKDPATFSKVVRTIGESLVALANTVEPNTGRLTHDELMQLLEEGT